MGIKKATFAVMAVVTLAACGGAQTATGPEQLQPQATFGLALASQSERQPSSRVEATSGSAPQVSTRCSARATDRCPGRQALDPPGEGAWKLRHTSDGEALTCAPSESWTECAGCAPLNS